MGEIKLKSLITKREWCRPRLHYMYVIQSWPVLLAKSIYGPACQTHELIEMIITCITMQRV